MSYIHFFENNNIQMQNQSILWKNIIHCLFFEYKGMHIAFYLLFHNHLHIWTY